MELLEDAPSSFLAALCEPPAPSSSHPKTASINLTFQAKNRVWGFLETPSGRTCQISHLTRTTATGSENWTYQNALGLAYWLSRDPIAEDGGINLYAYCGNNPVVRTDPLGLDPIPTPVPGAPANWPPPPAKIPGGPWRWARDLQNKRGGTLRPSNPPPGQSCPTLTWSPPTNDPREGNPNGYWKKSDGSGNDQRYDPAGDEIDPSEAHPGRPGETPPEPPEPESPETPAQPPEPIMPAPVDPGSGGEGGGGGEQGGSGE